MIMRYDGPGGPSREATVGGGTCVRGGYHSFPNG